MVDKKIKLRKGSFGRSSRGIPWRLHCLALFCSALYCIALLCAGLCTGIVGQGPGISGDFRGIPGISGDFRGIPGISGGFRGNKVFRRQFMQQADAMIRQNLDAL